MRKPHRQPGPCPYAHMRMENIMRKSSVRKKSSWFLLVLVAAASLGLAWRWWGGENSFPGWSSSERNINHCACWNYNQEIIAQLLHEFLDKRYRWKTLITMNILGVNHTDAARCSFLSRRIMARVNGFSQTGKLKFRVKLFETQVVVDSYLAIRWMISVGTWKPGAQRFGDSGLLAGSQTVSRNVCSSHYPPRVNIERNNNYCLIGQCWLLPGMLYTLEQRK